MTREHLKSRWLLPAIPGLVLTGLALVALAASRFPGPFDAAVVGTWGEWASAVGAVGAITAALWIVQQEQSAQQRRDADLLTAELAAIASRVVVFQQMCELDTNTGEAITCVWVNVFGVDPLRYVRVTARWPEGEAVEEWGPVEPYSNGESPESWQNPDNSSESIATAPHIDPGRNGWRRLIRGSYYQPGIWPLTTVRWFDRRGDEWCASPGRLPERVVAGEERDFDELTRNPNWF